MGMTWTLILKYQITNKLGKGKKPPKEVLLGWAQQYLQSYPELHVKDFHERYALPPSLH